MRPQLILNRWRAVVRSAGLLALAVALSPATSSAQSAPDCAATCTACAPCGTLCTDNSGTSPALSACALQSSATCSWLQPCSTVCTSSALCSTKCVDTSVPACTQSSPETTCGQMPGSQDICQQPSGQLLEEMSFYHQDHLGSVRMITNAQGAVVSRHDYLPFGEEIPAGQFGRTSAAGYGASDLAPQRFTGKERDSESQLDYFGARYYSGAMGRFVTPDAPLADQHPGDPQSWNLYAYTTNSPLRFIDTNGQLKLDANGHVVFTQTGTDIIYHGRAVPAPVPYQNGLVAVRSWQAQVGYVEADDGRHIPASKAISPVGMTVLDPKGNAVGTVDWTAPSGFDNSADCHGTTFAKGEVWIDNKAVPDVIAGDGYSPTTTPAVGDVGVYTEGTIPPTVHSVTVNSVDPKTGAVRTVTSKGGIEQKTVTTPRGAWRNPATITYYHKAPPLPAPTPSPAP